MIFPYGPLKCWPMTVAVVTVFVFISFGCSGKKSEQMAKKPAAPVLVSAAATKDVPVQIRAIGNVEATESVAIKSQVTGALLRVHFTEGQDVKKGDLLFTIDPALYEAQLKQAQANLARDIAQFENARKQDLRYAELVKKGYVAQEQYDQMRTAAEALDATVAADKAAVENARLQLSYCSIRSPLSGRTGSLLVHEGNLIKANADTHMMMIHRVQPIYITFALPEQRLADIRKYMAAGGLTVEAFVQPQDQNPEKGRLSFIENEVDKATGTIKLKGTFENRERKLWPGQFVNVNITLTTIKNAVTIPSPAVQTGQQGQYVFVVRDDTAEVRPVTTGVTYQDSVVIEKGLQPGERVVIDGQMRLVPGGKVEVRDQTLKAPASKDSSVEPAPLQKAK